MIRRIYLDFIKDRVLAGDLGWFLARVLQYGLIHASFLSRRPLCGPALGTLVTNYRCNYHCRMCDLPMRDKELREKGLRELDTAQLKIVLKEFSDLGTPGIGFTGGEPLLRNDIFDLLAYAKSLGMITHLNTNGFFLNEKNIRRVIEARVDSINISMDGARPETHDRIRGHDGAFQRVLDAISTISSMRKKTGAAMRLKTVAVIDEMNIGEVRDMVGLSAEAGADCIEFIPRQRFLQAQEESQTSPDKAFADKIDEMTEFLLSAGTGKGKIKIENSHAHLRLFRHSFRDAASPLTCYAGYNSCAVDCFGEAYPCVPWFNWSRPAGNIRTQGLRELWYSSEYNKARKEVSSCRKCYLNCQTELNILFNLRKVNYAFGNRIF